jgi:hypothetical protein
MLQINNEPIMLGVIRVGVTVCLKSREGAEDRKTDRLQLFTHRREGTQRVTKVHRG